MMEIFKPDLYGPRGTTSAPDYPSLKGGKCAHCGYVFFPFQAYGCEVCGASSHALRPLALSGCGTLIASAKVHIHNPPANASNMGLPQAPFMIGSIKLDDGPTIRAFLVDVDEGPLIGGQRMVSKLVPLGGGPKTVFDLRFTSAR
ncbi:hypothetical protein GGD65_006318 [Bradyrhizobium sp. CIR18]|uniref:Zn-ribbon domain-containing OB-fold protein n=1 Tax=Bradyrhizobium sp. CIR18 TaxID=2663839 RepID=UPI0018273D45|nr:OB-fold domain-containing protein [Bradyrhizobium sp. CIR18]MBB4365252.1 hypothetical protein [Bradyrhizobium sp. CIR18]